MNKIKTIGAATLGIIALSACGGPTPSEQVVTLQETGYNAIPTATKLFKCVPGGTQGEHDFGGSSYSYPTSERSFVFKSNPDGTVEGGADRGNIEVLSKDGLIVQVPGDIKFTLNTDCSNTAPEGKEPNMGVLGEYHKRIGGRYTAYLNEDGTAPEGYNWPAALNLYIGGPIEALMDREAQKYDARDLVNDPATKAKWEQAVLEALPKLVQEETPGSEEFFLNFSALIQKPLLPPELQQVILEEQTRVSSAQADQAEADAREKAARAQIAVERAEAEKQRQKIAPYGSVEGYVRAKLAEQGINPNLTVGTAPQVVTQQPAEGPK